MYSNINNLNSLALGSRLKILTDHLFDEVDVLYGDLGIPGLARPPRELAGTVRSLLTYCGFPRLRVTKSYSSMSDGG